VVDGARNAVSMTYTLEQGYGSKITVPGAGFLLNNEMGDFNPAPGLTTPTGLIPVATIIALSQIVAGQPVAA
jgi:gamma-glutamyltranspeptidase/glutathione hydrolase